VALNLVLWDFKTGKEAANSSKQILFYLLGVKNGVRIVHERIKPYNENVHNGGLTEGKDCDTSKIAYNA